MTPCRLGRVAQHRALSTRPAYRHPWRGGFPEEGDFLWGEVLGGVDEVAEVVFEAEGFGGEGAHGGDGAGVLVAQVRQRGGGERPLLPAHLADFRHEGVAVEVQQGLELRRRFRHLVFYPEPVEKLAGWRWVACRPPYLRPSYLL
jgi:hypothetical protein